MDNVNPRSPTCQVQFTTLKFGSETSTPDVAYRQFHSRVIIDSQRISWITDDNPQRTLAAEKATLVTVTSNTTKTKTGGGAFGATTSPFPLPSFNFSAIGNYATADTEGTSSATKQFNFRITQQSKLGAIWWGFDEHDTNRQKDGTILEESELPTAKFHFSTEANEPAPGIPEHIDAEVASYWSIIPSPTVTSNLSWLSKIIPLPSNDSPVSQYSHLCQMTSLKIPSDLKQDSYYCANLHLVCTSQHLRFEADVLRPGSESVKIETKVTRRTDSTSFNYGKRSF